MNYIKLNNILGLTDEEINNSKIDVFGRIKIH